MDEQTDELPGTAADRVWYSRRPQWEITTTSKAGSPGYSFRLDKREVATLTQAGSLVLIDGQALFTVIEEADIAAERWLKRSEALGYKVREQQDEIAALRGALTDTFRLINHEDGCVAQYLSSTRYMTEHCTCDKLAHLRAALGVARETTGGQIDG